VRLLEDVRLPGARRALVTILEEPPLVANETALLSEAALSDWNRSEEEAAWSRDAELARREREIRSGQAVGKPANEVFARLRTPIA
jgi:hypothetical protein